MKNYYSILGISETDSLDTIKSAYRKLALLHHPDKTNGNKVSEEKFKEISEAYNTLGDKEKKKSYDELRNLSKRPVFDTFDTYTKNSGYGAPPKNPFRYGNSSTRGRSTAGKMHKPVPTSEHLDITLNSSITLEEALQNGKIDISFPRVVVKPQYSGPAGIEIETKSISIDVDLKATYLPIRLENNKYFTKVRVPKLGNEEICKYEDIFGDITTIQLFGDLYVEIELVVPKNITIDVANIIHIVEIPLYKLFVSDEKIIIETILGKKYSANVHQPKSASNLQFIIENTGIRNSIGYLGNYIIKFDVIIPNISNLNKKDKETFIKLIKEI